MVRTLDLLGLPTLRQCIVGAEWQMKRLYDQVNFYAKVRKIKHSYTRKHKKPYVYTTLYITIPVGQVAMTGVKPGSEVYVTIRVMER